MKTMKQQAIAIRKTVRKAFAKDPLYIEWKKKIQQLRIREEDKKKLQAYFTNSSNSTKEVRRLVMRVGNRAVQKMDATLKKRLMDAFVAANH
tara:strand:+ start:193 stop:468 length:276 start_codon:yes stop_codon:yes gene_type:complete